MDPTLVRLNINYNTPGDDWDKARVITDGELDILATLKSMKASLINDITTVRTLIACYYENPGTIRHVIPNGRNLMILSDPRIAEILIDDGIADAAGTRTESDVSQDVSQHESEHESEPSLEQETFVDIESNYERKKKLYNLLNEDLTGLNESSDSDSEGSESEDDIIDLTSIQETSLYKSLGSMASNLADSDDDECSEE
jgi:hypothetical protein